MKGLGSVRLGFFFIFFPVSLDREHKKEGYRKKTVAVCLCECSGTFSGVK